MKCENCGGNIIINLNSSSGICDSCGSTIDIDNETIVKYKSVFDSAGRQMRLNSVKGYNEAIRLFESIPFVDGIDGEIEICNQRLSELDKKNKSKQISAESEGKKDTAIGIILVIMVILAVLFLIAGICIAAYKFIHGEMSAQATIICGCLIAVSVILFIVSKIKG